MGATDASEANPHHLELGVNMSYRSDNVDWNIANEATGTLTPNVISELRWNNLKIRQSRLHLNLNLGKVLLRGSVAGGKIISGANEDSDYAGDNRSLEWSRSHNDAGVGKTGDFSAGIGYRLTPTATTVSFAPLIGYAWHGQQLHMRNGTQTVSKTTTLNGTIVTAQPLGPVPGLNSSYTTSWNGAWLGLLIDWPQNRWRTQLSTRYEWMNYRGEANWNLRADLQHPVSFLHLASGTGWRIAGKLEYAVTPKWRIGINGSFSRFSTRTGTDTFFAANGSTGETRLNEVNWHSISMGLTTSYHY